MNKRVVVTGGSGFIGAYLVKRLLKEGWRVVVIDSLTRGDVSRLQDVISDIEFHQVDVRDEDAVTIAVKGADVVMHLAAVNGTENFYKQPELVLDVGVRGALAVVNACRRAAVPDLVFASTAEVYQTPSIIPTPETIPLMLPDSLNPRFSYGGSKIISELIAFNYGQDHFQKVQVFRPHNVYGPDMGWKHVIPQFIRRAVDLLDRKSNAALFPIQGDGHETRAFCYVDDIVEGIVTMYDKGGHREIYHIGNDGEISIRELVERVGQAMSLTLQIEVSERTVGNTPRRCPDISKMRALGYQPKVGLTEGLQRTVSWYLANKNKAVVNELL
jgi:nucleoside-diphosphate-sugar epimerase